MTAVLKYKVEIKHDKWLVELGCGKYSDYEKFVFVVSAISSEEVWKWVKRLYDEEKLPTDDNYKFWGENENSYAGHVLTSEEYGDHPKNHGYGRFHALGIVVTIKPLPVYYFKA